MESRIEIDEIAASVASAFDFPFNGVTTFTPPAFRLPCEPFGVGLIVGPSGSGKSTILRGIGTEECVEWMPAKCIASHFQTADEAAEKLAAVGLSSIPAWLRPRHLVSTGEGFRADLARRVRDGAVIDEFTSVVDRTVAKACSVALRRYVDRRGVRGLVLATCHYDVIEWLQPDWVFDTATGVLTPRGALPVRPKIIVEIERCAPSLWRRFADHHYLDGRINASARCWAASWGDTLIGFASAIAFPNGNIRNGWRGHRTVVLPDYQGLGIGVRLSDAVGSIMVAEGARYFSKTAHPRMGGYRDASPLWRATSKNGKARADYKEGRATKEDGHKMKHAHRTCWSHEYIGESP
jgi:GNAT superfamily N-acetyltransferase/ABC-type ATPase involved in cell division